MVQQSMVITVFGTYGLRHSGSKFWFKKKEMLISSCVNVTFIESFDDDWKKTFNRFIVIFVCSIPDDSIEVL